MRRNKRTRYKLMKQKQNKPRINEIYIMFENISFLSKVKKDWPTLKLANQKGENTQINKMRDEQGDIRTHSNEIQINQDIC